MIKCTCISGYTCQLCQAMLVVAFQILTAVLGAALGLFLFLRPSKAINAQRIFYEKINWHIEPVSIDKEIRNTKAMGLFLIVIVLVYILISICVQAYADERVEAMADIEKVSLGDNIGAEAGDQGVDSAEPPSGGVVYERDAMGNKVPAVTDNSGDTNPIEEPL